MSPDDVSIDTQLADLDFGDLLRGKMRPEQGLYLMSQRLKRNLSQEDLAQALGTNRMFICRIERGIHCMSLAEREKFGAYFGIPAENFESTPNGLAEL